MFSLVSSMLVTGLGVLKLPWGGCAVVFMKKARANRAMGFTWENNLPCPPVRQHDEG